MWDRSSNLGLEILVSQFAKKKSFCCTHWLGPRTLNKNPRVGPTEKIPYGTWVGFEQFPIVPLVPLTLRWCQLRQWTSPNGMQWRNMAPGLFKKSSQLSVEQRGFGNHEITHTIPLWTWRNQLHEVTLLDLAEAHWCSRFWAISIWFRSLPSPSPCQGTQKNRGKVFGISVACRRLVNTLKILGHYRWRIGLKKAHKMRQKEGEVVCMVSGVMQGGMCNSEDHSEGSPEISR